MTLYDRLLLLPLACLLAAPACIIVADDDSGDSGNDGTPTTNDGTGPATGGATSAATGDTAAEDETAADDTAGGQGCGWGPTGDEQVPDGYVCGGDGADPAGMFDLMCPEGVTLEVGGDCGEIPGPGCCGPQGDAWFCGQGAEGPELARLDC